MAACEVVGLESLRRFLSQRQIWLRRWRWIPVVEFRSVIVDSVLLNLVNRQRLTVHDFEPGPGGRRLPEAGGAAHLFSDAYTARINTEVYYAPAQRKVSYLKLFRCRRGRLRKVIEGTEPEYAAYLTR